MQTVEIDLKGVVVTCPECGQKNRLQYGRFEDRVRCGKCKAELPPLQEPIEVSDEAEFTALIESASVPVLVDFWAEWCGPCKMVAPELRKVAANAAGKLIVVKVNTEHSPELARRYGISSIPALLVFKGGVEAGRTAGARPANAILAFVQQAAASHR